MLKKIKICLFVIICSGLSLADVRLKDGFLSTSILRLIANPSIYNGKKVVIRGYYVHGLELSAIFPSKEDTDFGNTQSGIWIASLDLDKAKRSSESYVQVSGTFKGNFKKGFGHFGMYAGEITDVTEMVKVADKRDNNEKSPK